MTDEEAGEALLQKMADAGCAEQGIDAVANLLVTRTLEIARNRAEYWLSLVE